MAAVEAELADSLSVPDAELEGLAECVRLCVALTVLKIIDLVVRTIVDVVCAVAASLVLPLGELALAVAELAEAGEV